MRNQIVGLAAIDGVVMAGAMAAIVFAALASAVRPAWQAMRIDPVSAIRG